MPMTRIQKTDKNEPAAKRYMKMKELSDITGVKAATIRYYINQGILPKPHKPHKNMAYYDESYIELIRLIRKFQKEYYLPLDVIKRAIEDLGFEKAPFMEEELTEKLFQAKQLDWMEPAAVNEWVKPVNKRMVMEASHITPQDFESCLKLGILIKDEKGCFNVQDVKIATLIAQIRQHLSDERGFSFEFITIHNAIFREMVDVQFTYFLTRILKGDMEIQVANDLASKCIELLYLVFPIIHKRYLNKKIKESLNIE